MTLETADSASFFWRLLLIASLIAAIVSLWTTGAGLSRYVAIPLAWALAAAVQLGLFGLAWLIGVGHSRQRLWISLLYFATMLFSVTFSYVTLQSELTERIRPAEAQRRLLDVSRQVVSDLAHQLTAASQQRDDLELRLAGWLEMERGNGWATSTCEAEDHCYLAGVCQRIRQRIGVWEGSSGRTYREGPGEALIYGALEAELGSLRQLGERLAEYRLGVATEDGVLAAGIDNWQRLARLDLLLGRLPSADLEAVTCQAAALPSLPSYSDHARDAASSDEQPVYAWLDLQRLLSSAEPLGREDYPTLFALALALFIDLFVLAVALGASEVGRRGRGVAMLGAAPKGWQEAVVDDVDGWLGASLERGEQGSDSRQQLLSSLLDAISFDRRGQAHLLPEDPSQHRFARLLVGCRAATPRAFIRLGRVGQRFDLEEWVLPALAQAAQRS